MKKSALCLLTMVPGPVLRFWYRRCRTDQSIFCPGRRRLSIYVISAPGAYKLSGNLTVPERQHHCDHDHQRVNVTIDMNGYSILGPTACTGATFVVTSCAPSGTGDGITTS